MKILAIETSSNICSVAIVEDNKVMKELNINDEKTHSIKLMPLIEETLKITDTHLKDIDAFACSVGPGSYTGIRIGVATMIAMCDVLNKDKFGIPSLLGLAYNIPKFDGLICSLIDSKNNNVYCGIFDSNKQPLQPYLADSIDVVVNSLKTYSERIIFIGDGAILYKEMLQNLFPICVFAEGNLNNTSAASIAMACYKEENRKIYTSLDPMYLKPSQAERNAQNPILQIMTITDLEKIKDILNTEFDEFWNYAVFRQELLNPNSTYILAKKQDEILGFGGIWECIDDIHVTNIVTRKDKRKLGIGSLILEKLIDISKNKNKPLTLEVNENNAEAIALYKKYNFRNIGIRKNYYNNVENALIMTLNI